MSHKNELSCRSHLLQHTNVKNNIAIFTCKKFDLDRNANKKNSLETYF